MTTVNTGCISDPLYGDIDDGVVYFFAAHHVQGAQKNVCVNTIDSVGQWYTDTRVLYFFAGRAWAGWLGPAYRGVAHDTDNTIWTTDGKIIINLTPQLGHTQPSARARAVLANAMTPSGAGWRPTANGIGRFDASGRQIEQISAVPCPRLRTITNVRKTFSPYKMVVSPSGNVWFALPGVWRVWLYRKDGRLLFLDVPAGFAPFAASANAVAIGRITQNGFAIAVVQPDY